MATWNDDERASDMPPICAQAASEQSKEQWRDVLKGIVTKAKAYSPVKVTTPEFQDPQLARRLLEYYRANAAPAAVACDDDEPPPEEDGLYTDDAVVGKDEEAAKDEEEEGDIEHGKATGRFMYT